MHRAAFGGEGGGLQTDYVNKFLASNPADSCKKNSFRLTPLTGAEMDEDIQRVFQQTHSFF